MTRTSHIKHALFVGLGILGSVLVEALAPTGALGHYQWSAPALAAAVWLIRALNLKNMPPGPTAAALVLLVATACSSCKTVMGPTPPPGTPGFVNCSDTAIHQAALNVLPSVETALASAGWEQALLTVVAGVGGPLALAEVDCAVAWVESEAQKSMVTTADNLEATKAAHAAAWLAAHPVTFAPAGP